MTLQEQMIKAMDEADKYSNKPFLREDAAKVCAGIAEQYAVVKWDEACEAQKLICSDLLNEWEFGKRSSVHHFDTAPKPEFKP